MEPETAPRRSSLKELLDEDGDEDGSANTANSNGDDDDDDEEVLALLGNDLAGPTSAASSGETATSVAAPAHAAQSDVAKEPLEAVLGSDDEDDLDFAFSLQDIGELA